MFLGGFTHTLDDKGRLTIPTRFRGELASGLVITHGMDRCLVVYPLPEWEKLAAQVNALSITDKVARDFRRLVFASAADLVPDRQGRILIPDTLRTFADLQGEVVVAGLYSYIELWNPATWREVRENVELHVADDAWATLKI